MLTVHHLVGGQLQVRLLVGTGTEGEGEVEQPARIGVAMPVVIRRRMRFECARLAAAVQLIVVAGVRFQPGQVNPSGVVVVGRRGNGGGKLVERSGRRAITNPKCSGPLRPAPDPHVTRPQAAQQWTMRDE